ncbi:MAG TPA: prepilin-type N-terminal cleavage/methylation domain-containing protein [Oligoflexia bacterium]|nr:prepilin-type N-terminal cleavage/methylation domain-containing protein [Oligoflexia bacterium]
MLKSKKNKSAFTVVELLVALMVLSVGLLGVVLMTSMLNRRALGASQMSKAVNLCQTKLELMKEHNWVDVGSVTDSGTESEMYIYGRELGKMSQKTDINELGNTWSEQFAIEAAKVSSPCTGESLPAESSTSDCAIALRKLGPYKLKLTMTVCKGEDYNSSGTPPSGTSSILEKVDGVVKPYKEPDCRVKVTDSDRPIALTCQSSDLTADPASEAADDEKIVKVLCSWRSSQGSCFSIASETTLVDLNL